MLSRKGDAVAQGAPPGRWWFVAAFVVVLAIAAVLLFLRVTRATNDRPPVRPPSSP